MKIAGVFAADHQAVDELVGKVIDLNPARGFSSTSVAEEFSSTSVAEEIDAVFVRNVIVSW